MTNWPLPNSPPRADSGRIREFLERYREVDFAHAAQVLPLMERDDAAETHISVGDVQLNRSLRMTYRVRADHLALRPPGPTYPPSLAHDVAELARCLEAAEDQPICIWSVALPDGTDYIIFELCRGGTLAGCVKSADQRIVNPRPL